MKARTKKMLALLLTVVLAVGTAACGNQSAQTGDSQAAPESKQEAATESKQEAATESKREAATEAAQEEDLYYNKEGFPIVNEPITIEVAGVQNVTTDWQDTLMVKNVEKLMGIKMNCTSYADSSAWATQYATMLASDSLPDLMVNAQANKASADQDGADGYLLDFTDYLDVMPNFAKFLEEYPEYKAFRSTSDGSIYSLDNIRSGPARLYELNVSKADEEKYGFSVDDIKTTEDFYNVLKSIKEQNPDVIPLSLTIGKESGQRGILAIRAAFGILGIDNTTVMSVDDQNQVNLANLSDNYRAFLTYMNRLYEEGLLDNEAFIQTTDEYQSKIRNGQVVFFNDWSGLLAATGKDQSVFNEYESLVAMTSEYNEVPTYVDWTPYSTAARVMVSAKTKYPEAICRMLDYEFTKEGQRFYAYGLEGESYDVVTDENGYSYPDQSAYWDQSNYGSAEEWRTQKVVILNSLTVVQDSNKVDFVKGLSDEKLDEVLEKGVAPYLMNALTEKYIRRQAAQEIFPSYLPVVLSDEESDATAQPLNDMTTLIGQFRAQFITGEKNIETEWDTYVEQISGFWDQIQPAYNAAHARMSSN